MRTIIMQQQDEVQYVLSFREGVEFCGYSVPHPVEAKMHLRIQTKGIDFPHYSSLEENATQTLINGLRNFQRICNVIEERYDESLRQ